MIHLLRHFSIRLWISLLVGSLIVLIGFPVLGEAVGLAAAFWAVLAGFLICFFLSGWCGNALGMRWVDRLMHEASIWERAGNFNRSEMIFKKAVAIFDSFLISPLVRQEKSRQLSARMARFYLSHANTDRTADAFIIAYLHRYPDDEEVSDAWLQKAVPGDLCLGEEDDLAFKIGEAQPGNRHLQRLLARACLFAERTDYQALKTYRRIIEDPGTDDRDLMDDIAFRFYKDRRADRWALEAFYSAFRADRKKTWLLKGMAACMQRSSVNDRASRAYRDVERLFSRLDQTTLAKLGKDFTTPPSPRSEPAKPIPRAYLKASGDFLISGIFNIITYGYKFITAGGKTGLTLIQKKLSLKSTRTVLKWTALGLAGGGLVILMINTAIHLLPSLDVSEPAPVSEPPVETLVTDPFTLQVAAYLKVEHAEKFVAILKDQGLDAYFTEAQGANARWYQVRISHFSNKEAARVHGEELKTRGVIDDFYVANYERP